MSAMSDWLEQDFLHHYLDGTVYCGLALGSPFTDSDFSNEASGAGYERVEMVSGFTIEQVSGVTTAKNTSGIQFSTATEDYAEAVSGWGLFTAVSGGNLLFHGEMESTNVVAGKALIIDPDEVVLEPR